ncbi:MAG: DUF4307 domain-containing protein [Actinomycetia bacterium]|nr:DUF4307 domain-containing protein [Actinomycetes bacterium]
MTGPPSDRRIPHHLRGVALNPNVDLDRLHQRYGQGRSLLPLSLVLALVVLPFLGWVVWAGWLQAAQDVRWATTGFSEITDSSVTVEFDVFLPEGAQLTCTVRAFDIRGIEVGRADVPVTSETTDIHVVYPLPVTARARSAFVYSCRPGS